jgi:sec-independent protein translocase protein TatC
MIYYYKYYLEIKNRGFLLLLTWFFTATVCYFYKEILLFLFLNPSNSSNFCNTKPYFIFTNVTEIFTVYLQLILLIANQISLIKLFYHLLMFLSLGLYDVEFNKLQLAIKLFVVSWLTSLILLIKVILPFSLEFFLSFKESSTDTNVISFFFEARVLEYFEYFVSLYYVCLLNCQLLVLVTLILNSLSNNISKVKKFRRVFYGAFIIFSTLVTPPDIFSQVVLSTCLIAIYECITFLKLIRNRFN